MIKKYLILAIFISGAGTASAQQFQNTLNRPLTLPPAVGEMEVERIIRWSIPGFDKSSRSGLRSVRLKEKEGKFDLKRNRRLHFKQRLGLRSSGPPL